MDLDYSNQFLLNQVGFSAQNKPILTLQTGSSLVDFDLTTSPLSLQFDDQQKFCVGWHDLESGQNFACDQSATVDAKFEKCHICQNKTGFNPAFYHAKTVSPQQEARNRQPHFLYLAYFSPQFLKVGISFAGRGKRRLLEQGARAALILETFSSALIARQYEAKIAALDGVRENLKVAQKIAALQVPFSDQQAKQTLFKTLAKIEDKLQIEFKNQQFYDFNKFYFQDQNVAELNQPIEQTQQISGDYFGTLGSLHLRKQGDETYYIDLKKQVGYRLKLSEEPLEPEIKTQQLSLF